MTGPSNVTIRHARPDEFDEIIALDTSAFRGSHITIYVSPYAAQYPEDRLAGVRSRYGKYFTTAAAGEAEIIVAELDSGDEVGTSRRIVGMAMWSIPKWMRKDSPSSLAEFKPAQLSSSIQRRDLNDDHGDAFVAALERGRREIFDDRYGGEGGHPHLEILIVSPDVQRKGIGRMLCNYKINNVRDWKLNASANVRDEIKALTLFSSHAGFGLYSSLGFKQIGKMHAQVKGDDEFLEMAAMSLEV